MDAIDAALVDFDAAPLQIIASSATPYEPGLKARVAALIDQPAHVTLDEIGMLDVELGRAFAQAALATLQQAGVKHSEVAAIGSHGQTLRHRPDLAAPFTWQISDPNVIAEATGITVVADFRRRDVAAGGQGAPLLPMFHDQVFRSADEDRVIANLGGIANITVLRRNVGVTGFDTGPANRMMDAWTHLHRGEDYDKGGVWAASGTVDQNLLAQLLDEPYLRLDPPKSTGRELFNMPWLEQRLGGLERRPADVQATLQELTAISLTDAIRRYAPGAAVYLCGGGAHNRALREAIARHVAPNRVASTQVLGLDPDYVEAVAFAWFARKTLAGQPSSAPSVTGATGPRILGGIYRYA